ncbi:MAG: dihydroneopterin aldolase [Armatimonadota bacterium]
MCNRKPLDKICIEKLRVQCTIGTDAKERQEPRDVYITVILHADLKKACSSDNLDESLDYRLISQKIYNHVRNSHHHLIEALAESVAQLCMKSNGVEQVTVRVEKPRVLPFTKSVAVEISRGLSE